MNDILPFFENLVATGRQPRVHPNGFLQFDMDDKGDARIHVWDQRIPRQDTATTIHDHKFLMGSQVYRGVLAQVTYDVNLNHEGKPTDEIYMAKYTDRSESTLEPTGVKVVRLVHDVELLHGDENDSYTQGPFTFHESVPVIYPVVTWMTKLVHYTDSEPRVLVPLGRTPDNGFDRNEHDADLLWQILEEAIR